MTLEEKIAKAKAAGYSDKEIQGFLNRASKTSSTTGNAGTTTKTPGMLGKAWNALNVPAEKSKEGLTGLTDIGTSMQNLAAVKTGLPIGTEPTGNMARDVIAGTPKIIGETLSETAPAFVDRTSIALAGAGLAAKGAGAVAGEVLPKVAPMLERGSGLAKGTLEAAYKSPSMIADFKAGEKATELYEAAKQGAKVGTKSNRLVFEGFKAINNDARLAAPDAFKTRKVVRAMMQSKNPPYPMDDLKVLEQKLGDMVFRSTNEADELYKRAIRGEQMRNISRLNKNGTTGPISAGIIAKMPYLAPFLSPALQGGTASLAGAAAQINPSVALNASALVGASLDRLKSKKEKSRGTR